MDASSLESVDLYHQLTQLSTQLPIESQANRNKAAVVQTGLQRMAAKQNSLDHTDKLLTHEFWQSARARPTEAHWATRAGDGGVPSVQSERNVPVDWMRGPLCLRADGRPR